jgi:hypothetical protein
VLDTEDAATADLPQVAFFDGYPASDDAEFVGTWSNYPYFPIGTIAFSGIDEGLFLVRVQDAVLEQFARPSTATGPPTASAAGGGRAGPPARPGPAARLTHDAPTAPSRTRGAAPSSLRQAAARHGASTARRPW